MQLGSVSFWVLFAHHALKKKQKKKHPLHKSQILMTVKTIITMHTNDPKILVSVVAFDKQLNDFIKVAHN